MHSITCCLPSDKTEREEGRRLYISAWYIINPEVGQASIGRSTMRKREKKHIFSFLLGLVQEGALKTSYHEWRGCISAAEERGRLSFLKSRQNSREQGEFTPVPSLVFHAPVNSVFLSMRVTAHPAGKQRESGDIHFPLSAIPFIQISAWSNEYNYLVLETS